MRRVVFSRILASCALLASLFVAEVAAAQVKATNPFLSAEEYIGLRGEASAATLRLEYAVVSKSMNRPEARTVVTVEIGPDWVLQSSEEETALYDFKLERVFRKSGQGFRSDPMLADLQFRVMERHNRDFLGQMMKQAGAKVEPGGCAASAELGVTLPSSKDASAKLAVSKSSGGQKVMFSCGKLAQGEALVGPQDAPAAFWPWAQSAFATHPDFAKRLRQLAKVPTSYNSEFRMDPDSAGFSRTLTLTSSSASNAPYPLASFGPNMTSAIVDAGLGSGMGEFAVAVLRGEVEGGPMTNERWNKRLEDMIAAGDEAAAAMEILPKQNMFPEALSKCGSPEPSVVCKLLQRLVSISKKEPATFAVLEIAMSEGKKDQEKALKQMKIVQSSRFKDHPTAAATFALMLRASGKDFAARAEKAGLPTDPAKLQSVALRAYPYVSIYWSDAGDPYAAKWDFRTAFVYYDIARTLRDTPMGEADDGWSQKLNTLANVRTDFPAFFLN